MKDKRTIGIDVDDVLSQSAVGFVAYSNQRWLTNLTPDDYDEHWAEMWKIELAEAEGEYFALELVQRREAS